MPSELPQPSNDIPLFWQQQAELLDLQADQQLVPALPDLTFKFMTYCVKHEVHTQDGGEERTLSLDIEGQIWKLIQRQGMGISWEVHSPDGQVAYTTQSQIENRLDREILDFRARQVASEQWSEQISRRLSQMRRQLWQWPQGLVLPLYWLEWQGFRQEESGWCAELTPDSDHFVTLWQGHQSLDIRLESTRHFIKRYRFQGVAELPPALRQQRLLTVRGVAWQQRLYVPKPGEVLHLPVGWEPLPWIISHIRDHYHPSPSGSPPALST